MKKEYIFRMIFWGIILLLCLSAGIYGLLEDNKRFTSKKNEVQEIANIFNSNDTVKEFNKVGTVVKASLKGKKLVIKFGNSKNYIFKIYDNYLETSIDINNSSDKVITMILTDSIAIKYGAKEKETYELFNDNSILNYNLNKGIQFTKSGEKYNVKISLNTYVKR